MIIERHYIVKRPRDLISTVHTIVYNTVDMAGKTKITIIAALGRKTRAIGKGGDLLWHLPGDLPRFKEITLGHPIIMGRKTFESIGHALPGRTNIVVTREAGWKKEGVLTAHSLPDAIMTAKKEGADIYVMGGGIVYKEALPLADRLLLTLVESDAPGDTFFPEYENLFVQVGHGERLITPEGVTYSYTEWKKGST